MDIQYLSSILRYDPDTGLIYWKVLRPGVKVGDQIGWYDKNGYRRVQLRKNGKSKKIPYHRLAWALHYNHFPDGSIDHINRIRDDNRICNLRIATQRVNVRNSAVFCGGVQKHYDKYRARIVSPDGRRINLGVYLDRETAEKVFVAVDRILFPNHPHQ
jgi:hypothetical protein